MHPNQVAVGFRLLARNLAIGLQLRTADGRPAVIREPLACRAVQVEGLATFQQWRHTIYLWPLQPPLTRHFRLPWVRRVVRLVA